MFQDVFSLFFPVGLLSAQTCSPIEPVWNVFKTQIEKRLPPPQNLQELCDTAFEKG